MEELQRELKKYPSSFDVLKYLPVRKEEIKKLKEKLLLELEAEEYDTDMQRHRMMNLISFLCFVLREHSEAVNFADKVLKMDANNMVALANVVWFSIKRCTLNLNIKESCSKLEKLKENKIVFLVAKAEIAFTYSRLGIKRYDKASSLYQVIIDKCEELMGKETNEEESKQLTKYLCIWMFGFALVKKRLLNVGTTFTENELDLSKENYRRVIKLYYRILQIDESSKCVRRFKARSLADLGLIVFNIQKMSPYLLSDVFQDDLDLPEETEEYFARALDTMSDDVYVLERSGKYFRYARTIERSIELLEKAVAIKGSSYGYHHLALSLQRKLDMDLGNVIHKQFESKSTSRITGTVSLVKSPLYIKHINYVPNRNIADTIIRYFDLSLQKAFNTSAMYDKDLFYRQLGMPEKALQSFERLIKNSHSSRFDLANAFEQAGFCLQDILKLTRDKQQRENIEQKIKIYLKSSIEISCSIVSSIPALRDCWKSVSELKKILGDARSKENKEDLLFLFNKMKMHMDALGVLHELEQLAQSKGEINKIVKEKVKKYLRLEKFEDAVITISTLPDSYDATDNRLFQRVYIESGLYALKNGYDGSAKDRILRAVANRNRKRICPFSSGEKVYDLFILCSTEDEDNGRKLMDMMNCFGLDVTLNIDRQLPGTSMLSGITAEMKKSRDFVIVFDFDTSNESVTRQMQHLTERMQAIVEDPERGPSTILLIKADTCEKVPDMFLGYKIIEMDLINLDIEHFKENDNICDALKTLLLELVHVKK